MGQGGPPGAGRSPHRRPLRAPALVAPRLPDLPGRDRQPLPLRLLALQAVGVAVNRHQRRHRDDVTPVSRAGTVTEAAGQQGRARSMGAARRAAARAGRRQP
ncbi:hypothetical protein AERYTH_09050 [Aeromicrobium erythreum]|uniref:Uncharacterized protein n=1 Tax=Aeromicrobium erythreum TaxID=2041 RepID=A0A0U3KJ09_9ACTN|nr:hypothetical protein AERYTH_09050 [Aeromicrobium erythreum]